MRMFAGPNGSGKSTLIRVLKPELVGAYVNPDDLETALRQGGCIRLDNFGVSSTTNEAAAFFQSSTLLRSSSLLGRVSLPRIVQGELHIDPLSVNSYVASVLADFLRRKLLDAKHSFTFETVMSSRDKLALLEQAQKRGYRTYLYYVATDDPRINVFRVHNRVKLGGHPVPDDKIVSRYHRSLSMLAEAIKLTNRAYIFDNSIEDAGHRCLAEITEGRTLALRKGSVPEWFKLHVLNKAKTVAGNSSNAEGQQA